MIRFDRVTVTYPGAAAPTIVDVSLQIPAGELCVVIGPTGAGKSTLLGAINGLVPHFTGGTLAGTVTVDGIDTASRPPRALAELIGVVRQDPITGFATDTVEAELAYGMEQLDVPPDVMRRRVEETLDLLGIADLRTRTLRTLSGGEQQRVAIGSVLTTDPKILVLDEPTSALDPTAAEEVLAAITRLVHDLGITVMMAEHRLERVIESADSLLLVRSDGTVSHGDPLEMMLSSPVAPPIVRLGRELRWQPLPLSVRDARRRATGLELQEVHAADELTSSAPALVGNATDVVVAFGERLAVGTAFDGLNVSLQSGEVTALMGRNGSGKSTLLWTLQGSRDRRRGRVDFDGVDPADLKPAARRDIVGLVPQTASDLLYLPTVGGECSESDRAAGVADGTTRATLDQLAPGIADDLHPRDLSEGQKLALVLAIQLAPSPPVLLLDEPTRGLDEFAKNRLAQFLRTAAASDRIIVVATHDVEFVASCADRVVVLADGEVVADGATAEVVVGSPIFAPQIAKVFRPRELLTVADVLRALPSRNGDDR